MQLQGKDSYSGAFLTFRMAKEDANAGVTGCTFTVILLLWRISSLCSIDHHASGCVVTQKVCGHPKSSLPDWFHLNPFEGGTYTLKNLGCLNLLNCVYIALLLVFTSDYNLKLNQQPPNQDTTKLATKLLPHVSFVKSQVSNHFMDTTTV